MKEIAVLMWDAFVELLRLPSTIKVIYKIIVYQMKYGKELVADIIKLIFADPIVMFVLTLSAFCMYVSHYFSSIG